jgi:hypothetical protein
LSRVYIAPAGTIWLLLRHEGGRAVCLWLEEGEVRVMSRPIEELVEWGWREWDGHA